VPLFIALRGLRPGAALLLAWLSGLAMAYAITDFLPTAIATYYGQGALFAALLFIGSVSVMCCSSHMLFALWYRSRARPEGLLSPLLVGAAWVVAELVRADVGGNPWGTIGYTQARVLPLVQIAEWTSVYGVSFVVVSMNAALADLGAAVATRRRAGAQAAAGAAARDATLGMAAPYARGPIALHLAGVGVVAAIAAAVALYGTLRLRAVEAEPAGEVPIAVVQGNVDLGARWQRSFYGRTLEAYLLQTRATAQANPPKLVVWPENAVTFFVADEPLYRQAIGLVLAPASLQLVTGGPYQQPGDASRVYNSTFSMAPSGEILGRYDKRVLFPFAEYYPLRLDAFVGRSFDGAYQFTPGAPSPPLPTAAGPAAVVTCNEALFPRIVNGRIAEGGQIILNLANDGWLGVYRYSDRVVDMVALRAVEHRRYAVRASSSGGSAVIAPSGRVIARSKPFAAEVLRASIGPRADATPYGRVGDVFAGLCVLAFVASLLRAGAA
jgi:apolipoprotein N-acyltransferase